MFLFTNTDDSFTRFVEFKDSVFCLLEQAKSPGESVIRNPSPNLQHFRADFILPEGCSRLNFGPMTAIECISVLKFDTVKRLLLHWEKEPYSQRYNYVIVYGESSVPDIENKQYEGVTLASFDDLHMRFPSVVTSPVKRKGWREERKSIIVDAQNDVLLGKVSLFIGAGVSKSAKLPLWRELLERLIMVLGRKGIHVDYSKISKDADNSNLIIGRALRKAFGSEPLFVQAVRDALYQNPSSPGSLVDTIAGLIANHSNIERVITYNFDDVLEQRMIKDCCSVTDNNRIDPETFPIYHVHGFLPESSVDNPSSIVFSEESYHGVYRDSYHWSNIEQLHALSNTTCFFIGLSMKDPNIRRLLDVASERDRDVFHYAFLYRREFKDPDLFESILKELRVKVIWYWSFGQLPGLLQRVLV